MNNHLHTHKNKLFGGQISYLEHTLSHQAQSKKHIHSTEQDLTSKYLCNSEKSTHM